MKLGITAEGPDLDSPVSDRFGTASFFIVFDSITGELEVRENRKTSAVSQSGINMVLIAIASGIEIVITGYLSPTAMKYLNREGIEVRRNETGTAGQAIDRFRAYSGREPAGYDMDEVNRAGGFAETVQRTLRQFSISLPVMAGVVFLIGLFNAFAGKDALAAFFSGSRGVNSILGALTGSLFAGNPVNSYVIGGGLLDQGVGISAVTAFMVSWVSVGVFQLPAEIEALGRRFAITRNALSLAASVAVGVCTAITMRLIGA